MLNIFIQIQLCTLDKSNNSSTSFPTSIPKIIKKLTFLNKFLFFGKGKQTKKEVIHEVVGSVAPSKFCLQRGLQYL